MVVVVIGGGGGGGGVGETSKRGTGDAFHAFR
jgi:hypothetical protein